MGVSPRQRNGGRDKEVTMRRGSTESGTEFGNVKIVQRKRVECYTYHFPCKTGQSRFSLVSFWTLKTEEISQEDTF